jgi:hypothetical protein
MKQKSTLFIIALALVFSGCSSDKNSSDQLTPVSEHIPTWEPDSKIVTVQVRYDNCGFDCPNWPGERLRADAFAALPNCSADQVTKGWARVVQFDRSSRSVDILGGGSHTVYTCLGTCEVSFYCRGLEGTYWRSTTISAAKNSPFCAQNSKCANADLNEVKDFFMSSSASKTVCGRNGLEPKDVYVFRRSPGEEPPAEEAFEIKVDCSKFFSASL